MKKIILGCLALALSLPVFAKTVLNFETDATYPPFESMNAKGEFVGFDIELVNALCTQMDTECHFHNVPFNSIIPSLKFGKYDAAIAAMNITEARSHQVDFSNPYIPNEVAFVSADPSLTSIDSLKGVPVAVQNGSTMQQYMQTQMPQIQARTYPNYQNAMSDLKVGRVKAIFADMAVVSSWMKDNSKLHVGGKPFTNSSYFGKGFGIAVNKGNTKLTAELNKALSSIKANGTYDKIYKKYFG